MYAKISKKGQITIPKGIREILKIEKEGGILFLVEDNEINQEVAQGLSLSSIESPGWKSFIVGCRAVAT